MSQERNSVGSPASSTRSDGSVEISRRPDYGSAGSNVSLISNYVKLQKARGTDTDIVVHQYRVEFESGKFRLNNVDKRAIFWKAVEQDTTAFPNMYELAYDGDTLLFAANALPFRDPFTAEVKVQLSRSNKPQPVQIIITKTKKFALTFSTKQGVAALNISIQAVDIVFNQTRSCNLLKDSKYFCVLGNSAYELPGRRGGPPLGLGIELWRGLFTSTRFCDNMRPMVNVDISHAAFYKPQSLLGLICDVLNGDRRDRMYDESQLHSDTSLKESEFAIVLRALKRVQICVTHRDTKAVFRIVDMRPKASSTMFSRDDKQVSVAQYFKEMYNSLRYPNMPVVQVNNKTKGALLPVEVCTVAPKQKYTKKLTPGQTSQTIRQCATDAPTRFRNAMEIMRNTNLKNDEFLKTFRLEVKYDFVEVPGRVLTPPKLLYKKSRDTVTVEPQAGVWRTQNYQFYSGGNCANYSALLFLPSGQTGMVGDFCTRLADFCCRKGINMAQRPGMVLHVSSMDGLDDAINRILSFHKKKKKERCDLLFVALYDRNQYGELKRACDVRHGVMTQCFTQRVLNDVVRKGNADLMNNLAIKVNAKLGGQNTQLCDDYIMKNHLAGKNALVLGVDVTHPAVGDQFSPSIAAVVGNVDLGMMKYEASMRVQPQSRETVVHFEDQYRERLLAFMNKTGTKPARIYVFRDGVAECQYEQILVEELAGLRRSFTGLCGNTMPKITFVIVQKRHHTRFMTKHQGDAVGRGKNIPAGTVVDRIVTSGEGYDFFLCSHAGIQGTSRPTKYTVIHDENKIKADDMQAICYYLCHAYSRCNRSVSIPAPVYYAHLACFRARYHTASYLDSNHSMGSLMNKGGNAPLDSNLTAAALVHEDIRSRMYFN